MTCLYESLHWYVISSALEDVVCNVTSYTIEVDKGPGN